MKLNMYAIYDSAIEAFMRPFFLQADGQASRMFTDICTDAEHEVGRHPECYTLMRIGVWDDQDGATAVEIPSKILSGLEAVANSRKIDNGQLDAFEQGVSGNGEDDSRTGEAIR